MKDFIASEKFLIGSNGQIGGVAPNTVNDIIKWDGTKWIAGVNPGGSGGGEGSYVANPFSTNLISGQSIQGILFGQALDSAPSIATDLEIDGDGSIIPYTISGINTTGYTAIFAEEIPNNNYKIHTVFGGGGGGGGGGSSSSYWQTGANDLYYNDNNVNIQRDLTIGGNLTVNGTQTIVNTETVEIEDHNLVIGANTHYTGFANPYPGAGDAYAGILWGTGDAGAASSVGLTYQSNKGFAFGGGNVGIGTTSPSAGLEVQDESQVVALFKSQSTATNAVTAIAIQSPSATSNGRTRIGADVDDLTFSTSNGASDPNSSIERMRIDSDGNVGIGTTDPSQKLDVRGGINLRGGYNLTWDGGNYIAANSANIQFGFTDEKMRITSSGNVGIGTTSPDQKLVVESDQADWTTKIINTNANPSGLFIQFTTDIANASNDFIRCFKNTSDIRFRVYSNGTVLANATEYTSDDRVKHNEQPIIGALETLSKITPKKYIKTTEMYDANHDFELDADGNPIDSNGEPVEHRIEAGVIAQQVLTVDELAFAVSPEGVDEDGTVTSPHGLDYNSLFTYAIAAIQEQQQLIEQLKSQNESLAARISALES